MKFNKKEFTKTYEWWRAEKLDSKTELIKLCLTSFLEDTFYESWEDTIKRIIEYCRDIKNKNFILSLAEFSREYWLRSVNHLLIAIYSMLKAWDRNVRDNLDIAVDRIVKRPDEIAEIIKAINYLSANDKIKINN